MDISCRLVRKKCQAAPTAWFAGLSWNAKPSFLRSALGLKGFMGSGISSELEYSPLHQTGSVTKALRQLPSIQANLTKAGRIFEQYSFRSTMNCSQFFEAWGLGCATAGFTFLRLFLHLHPDAETRWPSHMRRNHVSNGLWAGASPHTRTLVETTRVHHWWISGITADPSIKPERNRLGPPP